MKNSISRNGIRLALSGAVIVIAGISLGAAKKSGPFQKPLNEQVQKNPQKPDNTSSKKQGKVHRADETNFHKLVLKSDVPVLVDFYADWCGPCRMLAPVLDELARETTDVKIVKVNVDRSPRLAAKYGITSVPSLKVLDQGKVVDEHVGLANKARLKAMLDI
jgi:thioredoxin 1